jgi:hypothetical protein
MLLENTSFSDQKNDSVEVAKFFVYVTLTKDRFHPSPEASYGQCLFQMHVTYPAHRNFMRFSKYKSTKFLMMWQNPKLLGFCEPNSDPSKHQLSVPMAVMYPTNYKMQVVALV